MVNVTVGSYRSPSLSRSDLNINLCTIAEDRRHRFRLSETFLAQMFPRFAYLFHLPNINALQIEEKPLILRQTLGNPVAQILAGFPGILSIDGDLERRELTVEYAPDSVTPAAMSAQLAEIGYPVAETRLP